MKAYSPNFRKHVLQVLVISLIAFSMDRLIVRLSHDDSIWMGEAIEVVGSVIFGPLVGFFAAFLNCTVSDYLTYHSFDYIFVDTLEAVAVALIGVIFRKLNRDEDRFGIRQIVIFNFVQILVNVAVLYLSSIPVAMFAFGFIVNDWTKADMLTDVAALGDNSLRGADRNDPSGALHFYPEEASGKRERFHRSALHFQTHVSEEGVRAPGP